MSTIAIYGANQGGGIMKWRDAEEKLNIWSRRNYLWLQNTGSGRSRREGGGDAISRAARTSRVLVVKERRDERTSDASIANRAGRRKEEGARRKFSSLPFAKRGSERVKEQPLLSGLFRAGCGLMQPIIDPSESKLSFSY